MDTPECPSCGAVRIELRGVSVGSGHREQTTGMSRKYRIVANNNDRKAIHVRARSHKKLIARLVHIAVVGLIASLWAVVLIFRH